MEGILSLELLLNLPKEILRISEEYDEYSGLIKREYFSNYDFIYMKEEINKQIDKYKNAKYFYRYPDEYNIKVTPTYELRESAFTQSVSNPIEKLIGSRVDDEIWTTDFYKKIINVSVKLTLQEAIYFVDSFFADRAPAPPERQASPPRF